jgi:hypothetical protein
MLSVLGMFIFRLQGGSENIYSGSIFNNTVIAYAYFWVNFFELQAQIGHIEMR